MQDSKKPSPSTQNQITEDPLLLEKKRARRRLVGAIVITLALVIILPIIFDSQQTKKNNDVDIQIPSREKTVKTASQIPSPSVSQQTDNNSRQIAKVEEESKTTETKNNETPTESDEATTKNSFTPPSVPGTTVEKVKEERTKVEPQKVETSKVTPPAAKQAQEKKETQAKPKEQAQAAKPKQEPKKEDKKEDKSVAQNKPAETPASGKFSVQVAAVTSQAKADELRKNLSASGMRSSVQKIATKNGSVFRVRLGPFATRAEAEKNCPKLALMNYSCAIIPN